MRNHKLLFFTVLVTLSMLVCSCDQATKHRKIIINHSNYDFYVVPEFIGTGNYGYVSDSIRVGKHSEVIIQEFQPISRPNEYKDCDLFVDSIRTYIAGHDSLHITKNLSDKTNWTYFLIKEAKMDLSECDCRIQIKNEHIQ